MIAQLIHLESESPDLPINLYINSPGGSITAMLADLRRDAVRPTRRRDRPAWDRPRRRPRCCSPAARPATADPAPRPGGAPPAGRPGTRHHPRPDPRGGRGRARPHAARGASSPSTPGRTPEQVREDTDRDLVLTPQAALDYGVVDAVLTRRTTYGGSGRQADRAAQTFAQPPGRPLGESEDRQPPERPTRPTTPWTTGPSAAFELREVLRRDAGPRPATSAIRSFRPLPLLPQLFADRLAPQRLGWAEATRVSGITVPMERSSGAPVPELLAFANSNTRAHGSLL